MDKAYQKDIDALDSQASGISNTTASTVTIRFHSTSDAFASPRRRLNMRAEIRPSCRGSGFGAASGWEGDYGQ